MNFNLNYLRAAADRARTQVYCPYSNFPVLASIESIDGAFYSGGNVENASLTLTVHAENNAVMQGLADGVRARCGDNWIKSVYVRCKDGNLVAPCGLCRQSVVEWMHPDCIWIGENLDMTEHAVRLFADLLPMNFGPKDLK